MAATARLTAGQLGPRGSRIWASSRRRRWPEARSRRLDQVAVAGSARPMTARVAAAAAYRGLLVRACGGGPLGLLVRVHGSQGFPVGLMARSELARRQPCQPLLG